MNRFMLPMAWRPWAMLLTMSFLVVLINIDYTAVNIALILISKDLNADLNTLQWLLSGYILAWAAMVVAAGQLADIFGKRRILLLGITLFSLSSLWCGLAQSEAVLIAGRLLQGLGGALFVPPLYTIIVSVFPEEKQGLAIGTLGAGVGIGLAMGPTFGGALIEYLNWRWIFLVNVPLCLLTVFVTMLCIEKEPPRLSSMKFDLSGSLQLGLALFFIVFGLNETEEWGIFSLGVWSSIGIGALLILYFIYSSSKKENRLIPPGLFSNIPFIGCIIGYTVVEMVFSITLVIMGLYLQNILGYSAYDSGIIFLAMTLAFGLLSPFGGKMVDRMDVRIPTLLGVVVLTLGMVLILGLSTDGNMYVIMAALLLIGVGLGISMPSFNAVMMKVTKPEILSTASGVFVMFAALGGSLGVVFCTSLLVGLGEPFLLQKTLDHQMDLSAIQVDNLYTVFGSAYREMNLLTGMDQSLATRLMNEAFIEANWWVTIVTVILCVAALILSYFTIRIPGRKNI